MCTLCVSNVIYHKFSHDAAFYRLNGKNVNVMLEFKLTKDLCPSVFDIWHHRYLNCRFIFKPPVTKQITLKILSNNVRIFTNDHNLYLIYTNTTFVYQHSKM